jgi:plasmid stabilization system protein ParE
MMPVAISDDALVDLNEGFWFYEDQQAGLGEYFLSCLRADIEGLKFTGGIHRRFDGGFHRLLSRVFPHAVFYTVENQRVIIWAVIDCRRDPAWILDHLRKTGGA